MDKQANIMVWQDKRKEIQQQAVVAVCSSLDNDKAALLVMPTGTGKTEVAFAVMHKYIEENKPVLWLTHRSNLKDQAAKRGTKFFDGCTVATFHGKTRHFNADVVVGMVPTLAINKGWQALVNQLNNGAFSLVVVDEAHHSPATQFTKILNLIHSRKIPCLGLTATPRRADGMPLHPCFGDDPAFLYKFAEAAEHRTIAEPFVKLTLTNTTINGVPTSTGDYTAVRKLLDRKIVINARNRIIIDKVRKDAAEFWKQYGIAPRYVTYCINIAHAQRMVKLFAECPGIKPALYVGDEAVLKKSDRDQVLQRFSEGTQVNMLCVVDLMNEGVDVPEINTLVMCRPTYSNTIYAQQLGRGTRPGKPFVLVFDFFDNYSHAYGARTAANTEYISVRKNNIEIDRSYSDTHDFIAVEKQVNQAFQNIDAYQNGARDFYPTIEEAYEACKKLEIRNTLEYYNNYHIDPKLPSCPKKHYVSWSFRTLSGFTGRLSVKEAYDACEQLGIKTQLEYQALYRKNKGLPSNPSDVYDNWNYKKLITRIPEKYKAALHPNVIFPEQRWKGLQQNYNLICKIHGNFQVSNFMRRIERWKKCDYHYCCKKSSELIGPKAVSKKVINKTTGVIFDSISAGASSVKRSAANIRDSIHRKGKCGGAHWEYVDDDSTKETK